MSTRTRRPRTFTLEVLDDRIAPSAMVFAMAANHGPARPTSQVGPVSSNPFHRGPARPTSQGAPAHSSPFSRGTAGPLHSTFRPSGQINPVGSPTSGVPGPGFFYSSTPVPANDGGQAINHGGPAFTPSGNTPTGVPGPGFFYGSPTVPSNDGGQAIVR